MAQHHVEVVIGRLVTDEAFRRAFEREPHPVLEATGLALTPTERDALTRTDPACWDRAAAALDPRLQKIALEPADGPAR